MGAGLDFTIDPAKFDESGFKANHGTLSLSVLAQELAIEKTRAVSARHPVPMIIGADQTMECDGTSYDKPANMAAARCHLQHLRGRVHTLHSAVCVWFRGDVLWSTVEDAHMTMRNFGDGFLDEYLAQTGTAALTSVGCYRLEERGAGLFLHIEGDFHTILGLPLLPLLGFIREAELLH